MKVILIGSLIQNLKRILIYLIKNFKYDDNAKILKILKKYHL